MHERHTSLAWAVATAIQINNAFALGLSDNQLRKCARIIERRTPRTPTPDTNKHGPGGAGGPADNRPGPGSYEGGL